MHYLYLLRLSPLLFKAPLLPSLLLLSFQDTTLVTNYLKNISTTFGSENWPVHGWDQRHYVFLAVYAYQTVKSPSFH